ncbi:iron-containing alcohol dehydrogenase [Marispirochaeta sp.]|uniref:iron-containing alcohol dehydrogenase n=1 Tax=Marispirochaeta sp. TaxID=2038653 RepID=UPI0029C93B7A|nr:iron-containing alcohol dehydrogenase [Marispirochaeta sp.]
MKRRILPTGTIICGTAAVEQIGHELSLRGIRRVRAVCDKSMLGKTARLLSRMEPDPGTEILIASSDEELPQESDGLILMGTLPVPEQQRHSFVLKIPFTLEDLSPRMSGVDMLVLDRRLFQQQSTLEPFFRELYRETLREESSYPFPLRFPAAFQFSADTELIWGDETLQELDLLLKRDGVRAPMLITDKGITAAGLIETLLDTLDAGLDVVVRDKVPPDSDHRLVDGLAVDFREYRRDALIAIGGGSVLDTAKGISISLGLSGKKILALEGSNILPPPDIPLYMVPTTSGTGSESTKVAVIADHQEKRKRLFVSPFLQPRAAVLDSSLTLSLPPHLSSITGMDAVSHAIEAFTCLGKNPLSDMMAWRALELLSAHLEQAAAFPDRIVHRRGLALASTLAGRAFSNSMVGMVHSIGHAVGGVCGASHGACMAVLLPHALEFNGEIIADSLEELLIPLTNRENYEHTAAVARPEAVIQRIRELNSSLREITGGRHPNRLREILGKEGVPLIKPVDFAAIAEAALGDASLMYNPKELDRGDILQILQDAW